MFIIHKMSANANIIFRKKEKFIMISFEPLKETLKEKNMKISHLRNDKGGFLSTDAVTKINKNENVETSTIDKICLNLDIPVEKVIKFVK